MKDTVLISIVLNSSTQKMVETKKIISLAQLQPKLATVPFLGVALIFEGRRRSPMGVRMLILVPTDSWDMEL